MSVSSRRAVDDAIAFNPDDPSPDYSVAVSRSNTASSSTPSSHIRWNSFADPTSPSTKARPLSPASSHRPQSPTYTPWSSTQNLRPPRRTSSERYLYTYNVVAGGCVLQFNISVEPTNGRSWPSTSKFTFRLSLKVDNVERPLMKPITMTLTHDPRQLDFAVFLFPGKNSLPTGCLYSYRVWLRVNGIDHRLFGEDELWVGKDPDFSAITDASFARLRSVTQNSQTYDAVVGKARVHFIVRWSHLGDGIFKYSLEYEAGGVGAMIIEEMRFVVQGDPRKLMFLVYTMPVNSVPAGASHRLRVWAKSYVHPHNQPVQSVPFNDSFIYQRIWKTDAFKIGSNLDFTALGNKMIMGFPANGSGPQILPIPNETLHGSSNATKDGPVEVG